MKSKHAKTLRLMATISVRMKKISNYHDAVRAGGQKVKGPLKAHVPPGEDHELTKDLYLS